MVFETVKAQRSLLGADALNLDYKEYEDYQMQMRRMLDVVQYGPVDDFELEVQRMLLGLLEIPDENGIIHDQDEEVLQRLAKIPELFEALRLQEEGNLVAMD